MNVRKHSPKSSVFTAEDVFLSLLGRTFRVCVLRKSVKNIYLRVSRDKEITLTVPKRTSEERVENFLKEKRGWLEKQLLKLENRKNLTGELSLPDGSVLYFLGQERVLQRLKAAKNEAKFFEDPFVIRLYLKDVSDDLLAIRTFRAGGRILLENLSHAYVDKWMSVFDEKGVSRPTIRIRKMRSLWGSCAYNKGVITLNENLLRADPTCIEYVVLHELTHFLYHAHDQRFYAFLSKHMPDWKQRKKKLNGEEK